MFRAILLVSIVWSASVTSLPFDKKVSHKRIALEARSSPACRGENGKPLSTGPFAISGNCTHYHQCGAGILYVRPCAAGTAFNPSTSVCDWPHNVPGCDCISGHCPDSECMDENGHPISTAPFEKPGDCDHFYQCGAGILYTMPCAEGTAFNPKLGVCDWPYNVPHCSSSNPPNSSSCVDSNGKPLSTDPFAIPGNCTHFHQCGAGILYAMPCAQGTAFNPSLGVCDWPYNVPGCGGGSSTPSTSDPECTDDNGKPISSHPFEKPGDCDHFYQCGAGILYTMPCAEGTAFNPEIGVCDWPYNVEGCGSSQSSDDECVGENGKPISGDPFAIPGNCTHFYQCGAGILYVMPCADGTAFSPDLGVCDWPHNVEGCGGSSGPGTGTVPDCHDENGKPISTAPFEKPNDCDHFYQCGAGVLYTKSCAAGTVFNPVLGVCDWPHNVPNCGEANVNSDPECTGDNGKPISTAPFEKPGDCDHFYQCGAGILYTMPCAEGTAFNPDLGVCDWPYNVEGCGGDTTTHDDCHDSEGKPISSDPFPIAGNCTHFYQCGAGILYVMPCAKGTAFNPDLGVCDWPYNVEGCGGSPDSGRPTPEECHDENGKPVSTPPFAIPENCTHFHQCGAGVLYAMPCAEGTAFNPSLGVCDWPYNVPGCDSGSVSDQCHDANGKPISTDPFEIPGNCSHFYQCGAGILYTMPCAEGTAFNPDLGVCDWPYNVPGCSESCSACPDEECQDDNGKPTSSDPFGIPGNCTHFQQCGAGVLYTMPCAEGTAFNPSTGVCDWPHNVDGCGPVGPAPAPECQDENGAPISTGPFPIPGNCSHFHQCAAGTLYPMPCAEGTVFNPTLDCCDWPHNVPSCDSEVPASAPECRDDHGAPISTQPFPIPGNCSHFYQCGAGILYVMPCAEGTAFNPQLHSCDWPHNVPGCHAQNPPADPACVDDNGKPTSTPPFEIPGNCTHFYQCGAGILYVMPCAEGTVFNPKIGVCDWPHNVAGCDGTTDPNTDPECTDDNGAPISTAPFEKPGDCDHFYQCGAGILYTMPCAEGTVFNPALGVCDWPHNVPGCGGSPPATTAPEPTTEPDCHDENGKPISTAPFEKPGDCDHFYQCGAGILYTMPCADGTVFNPDIGVCDWPDNVEGCNGAAPTPGTNGPDPQCQDKDGKPLSTPPFEKPGDCDHFYQCGAGILYTMPCAEGTVFNPAIGVCDWPYNVPGCGGSPAPPAKPPVPDCHDEHGQPISTAPFEKPGDCDHFYQCGAGILYTMPCAEGTAFNPDLGVCDWPSNVEGCDGAAPTPGTGGPDPQCQGKDGKPLSTPPFEKPGDCKHFYQCGAGILYTMPCAKGTAFNPSIGVCDWPYNVPGCGGSPPSDSPMLVNVCEHYTETINCSGSATIRIQAAAYGRSDDTTCIDYHEGSKTVPAGGCVASPSMSVVSGACDGKSWCTLSASNDVFGDPCVNTYKYLAVKYTCV